MRNEKIDNIKGILIILVVFGHSLELIMGHGWERELYVVIYSFHMPLFIYTTGYFAKFQMKKVIKNLCFPYVLFQTIYILVMGLIRQQDMELQYVEPYWLLWYLFATAVWTCLLVLVENRNPWLQLGVLGVSVLVSLFGGYVEEIGREFSLSRILVYFPFFLLGYEAHEWKAQLAAVKNRIPYLKQMVFSTLTVMILISVVWAPGLKLTWLYEATSYEKSGYGIGFRFLHLCVALVWILAAELFVSCKPIRVLNYLGRHTMPIFLLHGFLIKLLDQYVPLTNNVEGATIVLIVTGAVLLICGSKEAGKGLNLLLRPTGYLWRTHG